LSRRVQQLEEEQTEIRRQSYKRNLVLYGRGIPPPQPQEDPRKIFCKLVSDNFGLDLKTEALAQCHRLGRSIVAEFLWRGRFSLFEMILEASQRTRHANVRAAIHLQGRDRHYLNKAATLKKSGKIQSFKVNPTSGKVQVMRDGKIYVINKEKDLDRFVN